MLVIVLQNCSSGRSEVLLRDPSTSQMKDQKYNAKNYVLDQIPDNSECKNPPIGMVCVPGGPAIIGADPTDKSATPQELSSTTVNVGTFYIDKYEVTNEDYDKCVKSKGCKHFKNIKNKLYDGYRGPKQPAVPLSWDRANDYCKWAGKRLPTEAEWEKAARGEKGTIYPWGNDPPSCDKANFKGCKETTADVGSYPPGHYGIYDMAGNGFEWVNDWGAECKGNCRSACGKDCEGDNPKGPCSGKFPCKGFTMKVLKGGSWWWAPEQMRGSFRRLEKVDSGGNRLSVRCATSSPILNNPPGWMISKPPADLSDPKPPTEEEVKMMFPKEYDTLDKKICTEPFKSPAHCKDPTTYFKSNESRIFLFSKYVKNLGGGYIGVAADGNYSFIAHARSRWVWLMDFDRNINRLHKVLKALIKANDTPQKFVDSFHKKNIEDSIKIIANEHKSSDDAEFIVGIYKKYQSDLYPYYNDLTKPNKDFGDFGWLRNPESYRYIRLLYSQDRIAIVPGDLLKDKTLRGIGESAKNIGTPIRLYYPSNAEEFWEFSDNYKKNLSSLPFDEASVALRTIHEYPWHPNDRSGFAGFWHYVVHGALNYQRKLQMPGYKTVEDFKADRIFPTDYRDFCTIDLPGRLPLESAN